MPQPSISPVVQEPTPVLIARQLRTAIADGVLAPGQQLHEVELSKQLGVSRGPLREALQRLTQEGLLESFRNRGVFVSTITEEAVQDIYLARMAVEAAAAVSLIRQDPEGAGDALLEIVQRMEDDASRGDTDAVTQADIDFHARLVARTGSRRLARMHQTLMVETRMCIEALESRYSSHAPRIEEHRAIAKAIRSADLELTIARLRQHMDDAIVRLA